ncbi:hypothetical protein HDV06_004684 [Boothiomyces sp. JEL0866]|nr:hypothetical protein HDV06_004684 [Boothiomyces sp. JEL0866]
MKFYPTDLNGLLALAMILVALFVIPGEGVTSGFQGQIALGNPIQLSTLLAVTETIQAIALTVIAYASLGHAAWTELAYTGSSIMILDSASLRVWESLKLLTIQFKNRRATIGQVFIPVIALYCLFILSVQNTLIQATTFKGSAIYQGESEIMIRNASNLDYSRVVKGNNLTSYGSALALKGLADVALTDSNSNINPTLSLLDCYDLDCIFELIFPNDYMINCDTETTNTNPVNQLNSEITPSKNSFNWTISIASDHSTAVTTCTVRSAQTVRLETMGNGTRLKQFVSMDATSSGDLAFGFYSMAIESLFNGVCKTAESNSCDTPTLVALAGKNSSQDVVKSMEYTMERLFRRLSYIQEPEIVACFACSVKSFTWTDKPKLLMIYFIVNGLTLFLAVGSIILRMKGSPFRDNLFGLLFAVGSDKKPTRKLLNKIDIDNDEHLRYIEHQVQVKLEHDFNSPKMLSVCSNKKDYYEELVSIHSDC